MNIEIVETTLADKAMFSNLYQFYMYDFSEMVGFEVESDGRFDDSDLDGCWVESWRHAFLLKVNGEIAGLALVDEHAKAPNSDADHIDMAEFFVMRKFRKRGVGRFFATWLFDQFRGRWRVGQLKENVNALAFWRKVIGEYMNGQFEDTTWQGTLYSGTVQFFNNERKLAEE